MKHLLIILFSIFLSACANYDYPGQIKLGEKMLAVSGQNLAGEQVQIPNDFAGQKTLLLLGYVQDSQFDIDRWLIGLDMTDTKVAVYEIPTIKGMFPRMFSTLIDNGMRKGIPKSLWKGVITVYQDGDKVQQFTGNVVPNNARVVLLSEQGEILYFYAQGFSVEALNNLRFKLVK